MVVLRASLLLKDRSPPLSKISCGGSLCVHAFRQVRGGMLKTEHPEHPISRATSIPFLLQEIKARCGASAFFSRYYQSSFHESSFRVGDLDESLDLELCQPVVSEQRKGWDVRGGVTLVKAFLDYSISPSFVALWAVMPSQEG